MLSMTIASSVKGRRRWLPIVIVLGFFAGYLLSLSVESSRLQFPSGKGGGSQHAADLMPAEPTEMLTPSETRSPKQVVEIQMQALAEYRNNRAAIHQVFVHASPTNRAVTGPLQRFEQMIMHPQYRDLTRSKHFMVGQSVRLGKDAAVLVTTVDEEGNMSLFRFLLSLQTETYPGCWMTDGVFLLVGDWRPGEPVPGVKQKLFDSI